MIHCTSPTIFCPPINCGLNYTRPYWSDQQSVQLSTLTLTRFLGYKTSYYMGLWDRIEACSIHSTHIWCGSTSQKINNSTSSGLRQHAWTCYDFSLDHLLSSNVPLWDFFKQGRCFCIYCPSGDLSSVTGFGCFRFHVSFQYPKSGGEELPSGSRTHLT